MTLQATTSAWQKTALVFLGLFLSLVLLEAGLRLGGFVLLSIQEYGNLRSAKQKGAYRILCLGESTTRRQYPQFLEQVLNQRNIGVRFSVVDAGIVGTNTPVILSRVESDLTEYHPDMVIAMMGINDGGRHMPQEALITSEETLFIRSCRGYKLMRLLWLHLLTKAKEMGFCKPAGDKLISVKAETPLKVEIPLPETVLKETPAEPILAEDSLKKDIGLSTKDDNAYVKLGWLYRNLGKFPEAEDIYRKAIETNPANENAYLALCALYRFLDKFSQAEDVFKKALEINPKNGHVLGAMASLYEEMGKPELAQEYAEKANQLRTNDIVVVTVNNYRRLKKILDRKGIKLVCVQYPMRNVESLKKIFGKDEGVIFVDNESVFKEALKKGGYKYKEYFKDMFGGDFGHCTQKSNELLAQNIAEVILREVFDQ